MIGVGVALGLLDDSDRFEASVAGGLSLRPSSKPSQFRFSFFSREVLSVDLETLVGASELSRLVFAFLSPNMDFFVPESLAGRSLVSTFGLELERLRLGSQPFRADPAVSVDDVETRDFVSAFECGC